MRAGPCEESSVNSEVTPVRGCHETPPLTTIRAYSRMYSVETNITLTVPTLPIIKPEQYHLISLLSGSPASSRNNSTYYLSDYLRSVA